MDSLQELAGAIGEDVGRKLTQERMRDAARELTLTVRVNGIRKVDDDCYAVTVRVGEYDAILYMSAQEIIDADYTPSATL